MKTHVFRLKQGADLKKEIEKFVETKNIRADVILSCVGSLSQATLRAAGAKEVMEWSRPFEIVGCEGTLSQDGVHIHVTLSDAEGVCVGGHLKEGCIVSTTAEIVIGESETYTFLRKHDPETGFKELEVK